MRDIKEDLNELSFNVQRSIRYHTARRRYYDSWHKVTVATALILGSAAVAAILSTLDKTYSIVAAGLIPVTHAINLVMQPIDKARRHHDLANDFCEIEKEITRNLAPTPQDIAEWKAQVLDIETREPPRMKVLNILMHNELCLARNQPEYEFHVGRIQRFLAHVVSINPDGIQVKKNHAPKLNAPSQLNPA